MCGKTRLKTGLGASLASIQLTRRLGDEDDLVDAEEAGRTTATRT